MAVVEAVGVDAAVDVEVRGRSLMRPMSFDADVARMDPYCGRIARIAAPISF